MCSSDLALAFCVCSAVFAYMVFDHETVRRNKKLASIGFFAALALGMLVKGPVALVMAGVPVFLFVLLGNRWSDLKNHAWLPGFAVFFLIAAPWYILMQRANPDFLYYFFVNENFKRFLFKEYGDQYGAGREFVRGMAFLWFLISNLPGVLLVLIPVFTRAGRGKLAGVLRKQSLENDLPLLGFLFITLFWCLTSRVLITYVLPTVPFFSVWLADRMAAWGYADRGRFKLALRVVLPVVWCVTGMVFASLWIVGDRWVDKMPGDFFEDIAATVPDGYFYFYRKVPYSAYFYLGDRAIMHANEDAESSEAASRPHYLVSTKRDTRKHPLKGFRRPVMETGVWTLYAPSE